jgi:chloramphenicol 3-O-phosphotransferase
MTKLIIIRGPSGAGKSSVAKALKEQAKRPTMLIVCMIRLVLEGTLIKWYNIDS